MESSPNEAPLSLNASNSPASATSKEANPRSVNDAPNPTSTTKMDDSVIFINQNEANWFKMDFHKLVI